MHVQPRENQLSDLGDSVYNLNALTFAFALAFHNTERISRIHTNNLNFKFSLFRII